MCPGLVSRSEDSPQTLMRKGVDAFFAADIPASAAAFDQLVAVAPEAKPHLWQRGLTLYYAGRFQDGREQFEVHRTVNPNDVENAAWHFLCVARAESPEAARTALLPVGDDARVPMKQVLALFAGTGSEPDVLQAASAGPETDRRNQLCYAHLYLGLYAEALGKTDEARAHLRKAAGPYSMDHYMGNTARVHLKVRGWEGK